ncbi:hypothetical protein LBMAG45_13230 [Nitrospirota bacterium]|nr:hypothetical protein LBMAG45_13230 [Nitrospirota bacterium]
MGMKYLLTNGVANEIRNRFYTGFLAVNTYPKGSIRATTPNFMESMAQARSEDWLVIFSSD